MTARRGSKTRPVSHVVIPDTQVRPGVPTSHLEAAGNYIADKRPDVIVHLGDHWDFPSLSSYEKKGSMYFEGKRYASDVQAGNEAMERLVKPIARARGYRPRRVFTMGNHEQRIERAVAADPILHGTIGYDDLYLAGWEVHDFLKPVEVDGVLYCLTPEARVLDNALRWRPLGDLRVGDELLAFDEHPARRGVRRYRQAVVEATRIEPSEVFRVELSNGDVLRTTAEHRWLCKPAGLGYVWRQTSELLDLKTYVPKPFSPWGPPVDDYETGWLAGLMDGEGHVAVGSHNSGLQLAFSQNAGYVLDRAVEILRRNGYQFTDYPSSNTKTCRVIRQRGGMADKLRMLGTYRPERLIANVKRDRLGRVQHYRAVEMPHVVSVRSEGLGEVVKMQTSSGTFIAEGYCHHNCHYFVNQQSLMKSVLGGTIDNRLNKVKQSFTMGHQQTRMWGSQFTSTGKELMGLVAGAFYQHDEEYMGPQGNHYWRGIVFKHEVRDGRYDVMFVSLDYLLREWL